ncbi:UNVERIFIED_CONTAM: protein arginine N-methyltransferase 1.6 [Sesamum calycinum]|uniref:Protein arginine N-methyltransferase 1.6 n=1 Tax=Sesamum calycinum TaxID=2727403 RepID=A0AAW2M134_9LAMI
MLSVLLKPLLFTVPRRSATATAAVRGMSSSLDSGGSTQRMFQLKVDPLTGKSEWVVIEEEEEEIGNQTTPKALLAATSYLDMLNDARRNRAFRQAIDKTVTGPCHVLDIGAGTGLLSMMAARAMGLSESKGSSSLNGMVTACESYLPMVKLMKKVLRANGMDGKIRIINKRSDELDIGVDIPSRADVLVSEILDSELLGEGLIPTLQHAHDKLLIEYPQTVPYRATIYGQDLWRSRCCLKEVEGFDHSAVNTTLGGCGGLPNTEEGPFLPFFIWQCGDTKILSETITILEFDFSKPMSPCSGKTQVPFRESGMCHGFVLWIDWVLDGEDNTVLSTGPDKRHWKQAVKLLNEPVEVGHAEFSSTEMEAFFDPSNGELTLKHAFVLNQR